MDHLHLLVRSNDYKTIEVRALVYVHERCGRRPVETMRLRDDCISYDNEGHPFQDLMDHQEFKTTMACYNSRELHQTGAFPQGCLMSRLGQCRHRTGSPRRLTCVACTMDSLDA